MYTPHTKPYSPGRAALALLDNFPAHGQIQLAGRRHIRGHQIDVGDFGRALAHAIEVAESVIDHLTKLGFEQYRSIPEIQRRLPSEFPSA